MKKTATVHTNDGITYHQYDRNGDGKIDEIKKLRIKKNSYGKTKIITEPLTKQLKLIIKKV